MRWCVRDGDILAESADACGAPSVLRRTDSMVDRPCYPLTYEVGAVRQVSGYPLWLGHVGDVRDLRGVLAAGVLAVVDLAVNEPPATVTRELVYCRFPLIDGPGNAPWLLRAAVESVSTLLREGTPTLVYCGACMSRTPCIAGAAIARVRGCAPAEGLAVVLQSGAADISPGLWSEIQAAIA